MPVQNFGVMQLLNGSIKKTGSYLEIEVFFGWDLPFFYVLWGITGLHSRDIYLAVVVERGDGGRRLNRLLLHHQSEF